MKDFKIYITMASLLLIGYVVAQYNKPKPVNWQSTLYYKDKIPFGTYLLYDRLKDIYPEAELSRTNKSAYNVFHGDSLQQGNYIIIAKSITLNKFDFEAMVKYIKAGNSVFMAAFEWRGFITDTLKVETRAEYASKNVSINFTNPQLRAPNNYVFKRDIANQYFSALDTAKAIVIGKNYADHGTFLSYKFGKGTLYLCATPDIFTNYSLLTPQGADYVAKALSYLPKAQNVYWDQYQNGDIPEDISPLRVFFSNPALQWAYYLSLGSILLFVFYEMKRRQRVIPVIEPLPNSTLEFVTVVGQVYYEKRNNANIAHKKVIYLLEHIREQYRLKTSKLDQEFVNTLAQKTGIDEGFSSSLISAVNFVSTHQQITDMELIQLNKLIEKFYSQTGYNGK
ncbi:hypothetical protein SAMN05421821_12931 [Mucilaginibacter lappiensis]|uniref:DUF4350 domain-containing protein n=1 Tax=Mucilaginibacter lappiensis TaxID=354630 RepID=A0ABR6PTF6_9SPHI|nr:DUF4350 domain-containing protein [Mucilaginibacter lappiensis]MBB6113067.1 hypothetical protein [Mucilaginibacter lappiensis]SIS12269.1 hypothetical protein SAMN05421821_12931 [Mucilaginibacter lappiensis]